MSNPKLSILVCTLPERQHYLARILRILEPQAKGHPVEILTDDRARPMPIGEKRNALLQRAAGDYVAFVDDDDRVSPLYVRRIIHAIRNRPDCVGLKGIIQFDGKNAKPFVHTIQCKEWCEKDGTYWRYPNHLNPIKRELAMKVGFPANSSFGEDRAFSDRVKGMLTTEEMVNETLYWYDFRAEKKEFKKQPV